MISKCPDCDCESVLDPNVGNGECPECHGTGGELDILEDLTDALSDLPRGCKECGGSGKCQTCGGNGYIND